MTDAMKDLISYLIDHRRSGSGSVYVTATLTAHRLYQRSCKPLKLPIDALSPRARRDRIWRAHEIPHPMRPQDRLLLVNVKGKPITRGALNTIWQNLMIKAVYCGVITAGQQFGSHDLKRRGITDTAGSKADKKAAGGHKSDAMLDAYDMSVPEVTTPGGV